MDNLFIKTFWFTNMVLWVVLSGFYLYTTNKGLLVKKGYSQKYISYFRRSQTIRIVLIALVLPVLEIVSALIVNWFSGKLVWPGHLPLVAVTLVVLTIPFKYFDESFHQKKLKQLATETGEDIAIDFSFRTLYLIFNPALELGLAIAGLLYGMLFLRIEQWTVSLFLLFPWLMYFTARGTRYQTKPILKDNYRYMFFFNLLSFALFFVYFFSNLMIRITEAVQTVAGSATIVLVERFPVIVLLLAGLLIGALLFGRIFMYIGNYRQFHREISGHGKSTDSTARKLLFPFVSVGGLLIFTWIALFAGMFETNRLQVGEVLEKYIISQTEGVKDTVIVIDAGGVTVKNELYNDWLNKENDADKLVNELKSRCCPPDLIYSCRIKLCTKDKTEDYTACCFKTLDTLPFNTPVKFEYNTANEIVAMVGY